MLISDYYIFLFDCKHQVTKCQPYSFKEYYFRFIFLSMPKCTLFHMWIYPPFFQTEEYISVVTDSKPLNLNWEHSFNLKQDQCLDCTDGLP